MIANDNAASDRLLLEQSIAIHNGRAEQAETALVVLEQRRVHLAAMIQSLGATLASFTGQLEAVCRAMDEAMQDAIAERREARDQIGPVIVTRERAP